VISMPPICRSQASSFKVRLLCFGTPLLFRRLYDRSRRCRSFTTACVFSWRFDGEFKHTESNNEVKLSVRAYFLRVDDARSMSIPRPAKVANYGVRELPNRCTRPLSRHIVNAQQYMLWKSPSRHRASVSFIWV